MKQKTHKPKMSWNKLMNELEEANKNPEFVKGVEEFLEFHTGKRS